MLFQPNVMASWLSCLLPASQSCSYIHLVQSLYQPVSLGVVGHGLQSLNAKDLAQLLNNATGKASTSVTQEPGQGPKDRDIAPI